MARLRDTSDFEVATLAELVGIANAIEKESVARYELLADEMRRRDETDTADAFGIMAREEAGHVEDVARWADSLGEDVPPSADFVWRLPPDLAAGWDQVVGSSLLTPYRAYAIAVDNEERAFAFYAYVAAWAEDSRIAAEAEKLAHEELRHAAKLRTLRRAAWRREGRADAPASPAVESVADLRSLIAGSEARIAARQAAMAASAPNDGATGRMLEDLARQAASRTGGATVADGDGDAVEEPGSEVALLRAALRPLEQFSELLEDVLLRPSDETVSAEAGSALAAVIERIAQINRRLEQVESRQDPAMRN